MKPRKELSSREVEELHQSLVRRLGDSSVPTLPEVAFKVVQLVNNPNSSLRDFVEVVQTDQSLTGRLLRAANSALYAQRQPVTQLQRAMVLLGLDRLKAMALGFHLSQTAASDTGDFSFKRLWTLSLFRAWTAFRVVEFFDRTITGEAFIVGLMLDAGVPMMPKLAGPLYRKVVDPADSPQKQFQCESEHLPFTHVDVVAALSRMWMLPALLTRPILNHHRSTGAVVPGNQASILDAAAYFVGGLALDGEVGEPAGHTAALGKRLFGLAPDELRKTMRNAAADFRTSKEMFTHILDDSITLEQILANASRELGDTSTTAVPETPAGPTIRLQGDGLIYELEPAGSHKVKVIIADDHGARLLSEEVEPEGQSREELRRTLMLENAPDALVDKMVGELRRLAA